MSTKKQIENFVANGNLDSAIQLIKDLKVEDKKLQSELISLSGRYSRWKDKYHSGTLEDKQELNRITQGILYYAGKCEAVLEYKQIEIINQTKNPNKVFSSKNIALVVLSLVAALLTLYGFNLNKELNKELALNRNLSKSIDSLENLSNAQIITDINALWNPLFSDMRSTQKESEKKLDLLGITLYAAWGQLKPFLEEEETKDWVINMHCLSPNYAKTELKRLLPIGWADDAENKSKQIKEFMEVNKLELKRKNIKINLFHYDFIPTIHGWKLGTGKIYLSMTEWSTSTDKLSYSSHPYEVILANDESKLAQIKRDWFNNWLQRAMRKE